MSKSRGAQRSLLAAVVVLAGCGGKVIFTDPNGNSGGSGGAGLHTSTGTLGGSGDVVSSGATTSISSSVTGSTGTGTTPFGPCNSDSDCVAMPNYFCKHTDDECGQGVKGKCVKVGAGGPCPPIPNLVCQCDHTVAKICSADISADSSWCSTSTFPCGDEQCKTYVEFCSTVTKSFDQIKKGCNPAKPSCVHGIVDCDCARHASNNGSDTSLKCTDDAAGSVTVGP